jgi:diguanylate cyclase (GGDEF)-like protein
MAISPAPVPSRVRGMRGFGRPAMVLVGIWALGLVGLGAVYVFANRVDETRRAQIVIADIRIQQETLLSIAASPALSGGAVTPEQAALQVAQAKLRYNRSVAALSRFGRSDAPARIRVASDRHFRFVDQIGALVARGRSIEAIRELGKSHQPGGAEAGLTAELDRADIEYGAVAANSRRLAAVGSLVAIVFLLVAFTIAFRYSIRARRRSHHDAMTDALTGLGNRRKLFAEMEPKLSGLSKNETMAVGIFDLDGFKAYNDTFGHPAGDALLARIGGRLAAAVGDRGEAYRIGGDEFVVTTTAADGERVLTAAQTALSEKGAGFAIGCSRGGAHIPAGVTLEEALHVADQRLYANKVSAPGRRGDKAKDVLLQVLEEQNEGLVTHLTQLAQLAAMTATRMQLTPQQVELTRIAAQLHDIGKAAIPDAILEKPGALDAEERSFVERHSAIGERIVSAAPTLEAIGQIVRAAHERPDGTGYPDGLQLDEIPISARIISVVDAFDAMANGRPYRESVPTAAALSELRRHAGTQFDAAVVEAFADAIAARDAVPRAA